MLTMTPSESSAPTPCLVLAFELGQRSWKLGFTVGLGEPARIRQVPAGALATVMHEIERAKKRLGLATKAKVVSCYEAGRDGFWLHRCLIGQGIMNHVIDSSSIEVNRRARRARANGRRRGCPPPPTSPGNAHAGSNALDSAAEIAPGDAGDLARD